MFVKDAVQTVASVHLDGVQLSTSMVGKINWYQTIQSLPEPKQSLNAFVHLHYYYRGRNPEYPQVGDSRIHFLCAGIPQGSTLGSADKVSKFCCLASEECFVILKMFLNR